MKVKNIRNIMFPKGLEFEKDIEAGQSAMVKMGYEQSERLRQAIQTGALEVLQDQTKVGDSIVHTPTADDEFARMVGSVTIGPREQMGVRSPERGDNVAIRQGDQSDIVSNENADDQLAKFNNLRGRAKAKFAEELTDLRVIREALKTIRKGKVRDILEAKLSENLPQDFNLDAIPEEPESSE